MATTWRDTKVSGNKIKSLDYNDLRNYLINHAAEHEAGGEQELTQLHSHANKTILDAIEEAFTTTLKNKLNGIEDAATIDQTAGEIRDLLASLTGADRLAFDALKETATYKYFTATLLTKLNGIAEDANNYSLPTATDLVKGGIKIGDRLSIVGEVLSAVIQSDNNLTNALKTAYDDAVTKAHTQNTDQKLDDGGINEVTAANAKDAVSKKHTQNTDQKLDEGGISEVVVADVKDAVDKKHNESHTLASHSTKPHSALTDITSDQHHSEKHDTDKHTNLEYDSGASSGLNFHYKAGRLRNDNTITNIVTGFVTLADDDISYVEVDKSGVISANVTGFTSSKIPLYQVTTATGAITEVVDKRTWLSCINVPAVPITFQIGWATGDTYNQHFHIRVGTGNGAEGGTYIIDKESKDNQADWIHFSPDTVIQIPAGGIDHLHHGYRGQYTIGESILAKGINYNIWKRVWDVTAGVYGDWDWLGSIVK